MSETDLQAFRPVRFHLREERRMAGRCNRSKMGIIKGICISEKKGTQKHEVKKARLIYDWGIEGDAHAGKWHRQISLLSYEKFREFQTCGAEIGFGAFGENLLVEGFDFKNLPVGTRFRCGEALLELTQIGKQCHSHCEIYKRMGDCIMPREGVFAVVLHGGIISEGDRMDITEEKADDTVVKKYLAQISSPEILQS